MVILCLCNQQSTMQCCIFLPSISYSPVFVTMNVQRITQDVFYQNYHTGQIGYESILIDYICNLSYD